MAWILKCRVIQSVFENNYITARNTALNWILECSQVCYLEYAVSRTDGQEIEPL